MVTQTQEEEPIQPFEFKSEMEAQGPSEALQQQGVEEQLLNLQQLDDQFEPLESQLDPSLEMQLQQQFEEALSQPVQQQPLGQLQQEQEQQDPGMKSEPRDDYAELFGIIDPDNE